MEILQRSPYSKEPVEDDDGMKSSDNEENSFDSAMELEAALPSKSCNEKKPFDMVTVREALNELLSTDKESSFGSGLLVEDAVECRSVGTDNKSLEPNTGKDRGIDNVYLSLEVSAPSDSNEKNKCAVEDVTARGPMNGVPCDMDPVAQYRQAKQGSNRQMEVEQECEMPSSKYTKPDICTTDSISIQPLPLPFNEVQAAPIDFITNMQLPGSTGRTARDVLGATAGDGFDGNSAAAFNSYSETAIMNDWSGYDAQFSISENSDTGNGLWPNNFLTSEKYEIRNLCTVGNALQYNPKSFAGCNEAGINESSHSAITNYCEEQEEMLQDAIEVCRNNLPEYDQSANILDDGRSERSSVMSPESSSISGSGYCRTLTISPPDSVGSVVANEPDSGCIVSPLNQTGGDEAQAYIMVLMGMYEVYKEDLDIYCFDGIDQPKIPKTEPRNTNRSQVDIEDPRNGELHEMFNHNSCFSSININGVGELTSHQTFVDDSCSSACSADNSHTVRYTKPEAASMSNLPTVNVGINRDKATVRYLQTTQREASLNHPRQMSLRHNNYQRMNPISHTPPLTNDCTRYYNNPSNELNSTDKNFSQGKFTNELSNTHNNVCYNTTKDTQIRTSPNVIPWMQHSDGTSGRSTVSHSADENVNYSGHNAVHMIPCTGNNSSSSAVDDNMGPCSIGSNSSQVINIHVSETSGLHVNAVTDYCVNQMRCSTSNPPSNNSRSGESSPSDRENDALAVSSGRSSGSASVWDELRSPKLDDVDNSVTSPEVISSMPAKNKISSEVSVEQNKKKEDAFRKVAGISLQDLLEPDEHGDTQLHRAVIDADYFMTEALVRRYNRDNQLDKVLNAFNNNMQTPLCLAVILNEKRISELLISEGADVNAYIRRSSSLSAASFEPLLHFSAARGEDWLPVLRLIINSGKAQVDAFNSEGQSAVHCAVLAHNKPPRDLATRTSGYVINSFQTITALSHGGANLNIQDQQSGKTPLHCALEEKDFELVQRLLSAASYSALHTHNSLHKLLSARTNSGNTALHLAASVVMEADKQQRLISLLISRGADPSLKNSDGLLPREVASSPQIVNLLKGRNPISTKSNSPNSLKY